MQARRAGPEGVPHATGRRRTSPIVSPPRVCRALPHQHRHRAGEDRRTRGTCGLGPGHTFRLAGRIAGVHGPGTDHRTRPAAPQSKKGDVNFGKWWHAFRSFCPMQTKGELTMSKKLQLMIFALALLGLVGGDFIGADQEAWADGTMARTWNQIASDALVDVGFPAPHNGPAHQGVNWAIVQIAVYDAVNSIEGGHSQPFTALI